MGKQKAMVVIGGLFIIALAIGGILLNMNLHSTMKSMKFIEGRYRGGSFVDYDNSIAVHSADDLGWYKKSTNTWLVKYGKIGLEFTKQQLQDPAILEEIDKIGLDVRGDLEEGDLRWYWCGVELKELVH